MKRKALIALFCIMGLLLAVGAAQATPFNCTIQQAGVNLGGYYFVYLTDKAGTGWPGSQMFLIPNTPQNITNAMLASALTALSGSTNVAIDCYAPTTPVPVGTVLYAIQAQ